uniref:Uncharacterized protein n=1 Tax=Octopus bimaculoides TaxID=37653 RepID=A0A0L8IB42_OCTBM
MGNLPYVTKQLTHNTMFSLLSGIIHKLVKTQGAAVNKNSSVPFQITIMFGVQ